MQRDVLALSHFDVQQLTKRVAHQIVAEVSKARIRIYGVPRGGIPVAYLLLQNHGFAVSEDPFTADAIVDDLVDSGNTRQRYYRDWPDKPFYALIQKDPDDPRWIVFPWEATEESSTEDITVRLLQYIGEDPTRDGLKDTPKRVSNAWKDWTNGYGVDIAKLLTTFEAENVDEMILQKGLPFYSHCEHHLAPFFGTADIAYIPTPENGNLSKCRIVGLSKISKVLDAFAHRLQVQERMTAQIATALWEHLHPLGVAVRVRARHLCMESRGIHKQGHETVTQALRGVFKTDDKARQEFTSAVR